MPMTVDVETILPKLLASHVPNESTASTTSFFGLLDLDSLVQIARQLFPLAAETKWRKKASRAAADINALVRACRFWRDVLRSTGQGVRLDALALASTCVQPDSTGFFSQLLAQSRHASHLFVLKSAVDLMLTHCTESHCTDVLFALRSSADTLCAHEHSPELAEDVLARRALAGRHVKMHVAARGLKRFGIAASQRAQGNTPGGALLVSSTTRSDERLKRPVFTYVQSERAQVFTPNSELRQCPMLKPGVEISCVAICGNMVVLCCESDECAGVAPHSESTAHLLSIWSLTDTNRPKQAESHPRNGRAVDVWMCECDSRDKGRFLEINTLVIQILGFSNGVRNAVNVRTDRYALATGEWSFTQSTPIHLADADRYGRSWRYASEDLNYDVGTFLSHHSAPATASPLASIAIKVIGQIEDISFSCGEGFNKHCVARTVVVSKKAKMRAVRFDSILPLNVDVVAEVLEEEDVEYDLHMSPCGTVLVLITDYDFMSEPMPGGYLPDVPWRGRISISKFDPELGWGVKFACDQVPDWIGDDGPSSREEPDYFFALQDLGADCYAGTCFGSRNGHQNDQGQPEWVGLHVVTFSPCGRYLAMLTKNRIIVLDLYCALRHGTFHAYKIEVNEHTRPRAIAWPDGMFVETTHGVLHIGTFDTL